MSEYEIIKYPNEILRKISKEINPIDKKYYTKLSSDMAEIMFENSGIGLAAPQIGINEQILIYNSNADKNLKSYSILINPIIIKSVGEYFSEQEGCLSVPELNTDIKRAQKIIVEAFDLDGKKKTFKFEDIFAVIMQHEIDHLKGILIVDALSSLKKKMYNTKIKKLQKKMQK